MQKKTDHTAVIPDSRHSSTPAVEPIKTATPYLVISELLVLESIAFLQ